jgi:hypothetical protein
VGGWRAQVLTIGAQLLGVLVVIVVVTRSMLSLLAIAALGVWYYYIVRFYIASARELTRLDSLTKSPMLALFSESVRNPH